MSKRSALSRGMIVLLAAASALGPVAMQIMLPAIPVVREHFAVSTGTAQLTLSLSMLAIAVATLIYGPLSDRYGRRPVMLAGILVTVLGSGVCIVAPTIEWLIIGRLIQAGGGAVGLVLARTIVTDIYPRDQSAGIIATLVMVMVVMPMLSPLVGGELLIRYDWHSIFYLTLVFSTVLLLLMYQFLPETLKSHTATGEAPTMLGGFAVLLRNRKFSGYAFNAAFVSVMFFSFIAAAPEIMVSVLQRPANEFGYYFVMIPFGFMSGSFVARQFSRKLGAHRMILIGSLIGVTGVVIALALQLVGLHHPLSLFMPVALSTFGNGLSMPNAQAAALNESPGLAGSASGLTGFLQMGLSALAAQLVALIFNGTVYPMLTLMLAAALISFWSFRLTQR